MELHQVELYLERIALALERILDRIDETMKEKK